MHIRDMRVDEYDGVDRLMRQLHQLHVEGRPDLYAELEHPYTRERYEELLADGEVISIAAEEDGRIIGICFVTMRDKSGMVCLRTAHVKALIVDEAFQHQGIARALFAEAEKRAGALGAKRMDLTVWAFNIRAQKAYESFGMRPQRYIYEKTIEGSCDDHK